MTEEKEYSNLDEAFDDDDYNVDRQEQKLQFLQSDEMNELLNKKDNLEFKNILINYSYNLYKRNFLNIKKIKKELDNIDLYDIDTSKYDIDTEELITYKKIMNDLDTSRSRLSYLLGRAESDYDFIEEKYKTLKEIWVGNFSKQSSDKKRYGEAERILYFLNDEKILRQEIYKKVKREFNRIQNKMDTVSRLLTLNSEMKKEYRYTYTDFDTDGKYRASYKDRSPIKEEDDTKKYDIEDNDIEDNDNTEESTVLGKGAGWDKAIKNKNRI